MLASTFMKRRRDQRKKKQESKSSSSESKSKDSQSSKGSKLSKRRSSGKIVPAASEPVTPPNSENSEASTPPTPLKPPVKSARVKKLEKKLDVSPAVAEDLAAEIGPGTSDVVVVANDSVSENHGWNLCELKSTLERLAHVLEAADQAEGYHVQFLNDEKARPVTKERDVEGLFEAGNRTRHKTKPLGARLAPLLDGYVAGAEMPPHHAIDATSLPHRSSPLAHADRDLLVLIRLSGGPTDLSADALRKLVSSKKDNVFLTFIVCADCGDVKAGRKWKAWYTKAVGDIGGVTVVGMYDLEKRESEERLPRDEWLAKALLGGKFDSYKKAPIIPAKKGWSLRQLGRFTVKREAS